MEAAATSDFRRRIRCRSSRNADDSVVTESFCFLSAEGTYTFRYWSAEWWFALAARFQPTRKPEGMDLESAESVSVSSICSFYLSSRCCDHRGVIANLC